MHVEIVLPFFARHRMRSRDSLFELERKTAEGVGFSDEKKDDPPTRY